jgi:deoxyribodipyrimidine photolyase-related protein
MTHTTLRRLIVILGDQLSLDNPVLRDCDPARDMVWMCEAADEATHVPSHKARTVLFLSAMRHFQTALRVRGIPVHYRALDRHEATGLDRALIDDVTRLRPAEVVMAEPGEHRVQELLTGACRAAGIEPQIVPDHHFFCPTDDFQRWAKGRKTLLMEHFYRHMRKREAVLIDDDGQPAGGAWNFDKSNRKPFGQQGPGMLPAPVGFPPDAITREVMALVERRFANAPGRLDAFDWPVTAEQAEAALTDFIDHRLAAFGPFQDAMWTGEPWLYHARLSAAMNLKLIDPRRIVDATVAAWERGQAPIASVEGFVRQVLGWREYVRGVYWREGPDYLGRNALDARQPLPELYWSGETDMACLRAVVGQVLDHGYAHHIQRLMVTGLFALLLGVDPRRVHQWYLAMFVDAVEWVEAPNTLGMSQFADGGLLASKPYAASGAYIQRMSNYCRGCRYNPKEAFGAEACPFTTLYWGFLDRHRARFAAHPRTALMWRNLDRIDAERLARIRGQARQLRAQLS